MFYKVIRAVFRPLLMLIFRVELRYPERIDMDGGAIMCANHTSNWDPVIMVVVYPRVLFFMAKQELFRIPVLGPLLVKLHAFPVNRGAHDLTAIKTAMSVIKKGETLAIFPEGTRNPRNDPSVEAKAGVAMIAAKTSATVQPVYISPSPRPFKKTVIVIGEPRRYPRSEYGKLEHEEYKRLSNDLMSYIRSLD